MKIHEYQAREILAKQGIPMPPGVMATTTKEVSIAAKSLGGRVVVKAQVLVGGRGKAGGVKLAQDSISASEVAGRILGMDIKGITVRKVLVTQAVAIDREIYLGLTIDRAHRQMVMMASAAGGVEIEEIAHVSPDKIVKAYIDPALGICDYQIRDIASAIGLPSSLLSSFAKITKGLYSAFLACDASLAEINPLVITANGELSALDAKIVVDDNSLYRHNELAALRDVDEEDPLERQARENCINYVKLDGEIGCVVNGAGLAMATMDVVKLYGASPANFLDIGGGAKSETVETALRILLSDPKVKVVLFNIFGGITRCDEVAKGIISALDKLDQRPPIVIRLVGTNEEAGRAILAEANISTATTMDEAAQKAVAIVRGEGGSTR